MPDHAPEAKVKPTLDMGAGVTKVKFDKWWEVVVNRKYEHFKGSFIHPVSESSVIAGEFESITSGAYSSKHMNF